MKVVKFIINVILSFVLVIAILATFVMNILSNKILNENYVLSKLEETEFYLQVSREVQSAFEKYIYQSGLPEDIIQDLFTEEILKEDINRIIAYMYGGEEVVTSEDQVRATLDNKINTYIASQGLQINQQGKENIQKFEDLITDEYVINVRVSDIGYDTIRDVLAKVQTIYNHIKNLPMISLVIIIILLIVINIKDLLEAMSFGLTSLLASGIILTLAQHLIFTNVDIDHLVLLTTSLSNFVIHLVKDLLFSCKDMGNYMTVIGVLGIIIVAIVKNLKFKEKEKSA